MDILCTERFWSGFGDQLGAAAPGAGWLLMADDGTVRAAGGGVPVGDEGFHPEVVVGSYDLWMPGGAYRPFFTYLSSLPPSLRWFQSCAAGFERELFGRLLQAGVRLTTGHGTAAPIAEYVLWAVLDQFLGGDEWRAAQARGHWVSDSPGHREVAGSSWLVVGLGSIGVEVARRARAFGAHVTGVRRHPTGDEPVDALVAPSELAAVLPAADVVVICAPSSAATHHLVDAAFLAAMRPTALLVNVARGDLVDEAALLAALDAGRPAAALLDVVAQEPLPAESPLWRHPRVRVTPHASGHTPLTNARYAPHVADNLRRYLAGQPLHRERVLADWRS